MKEVFSRKQQEVEERIKELERQMMQYCDVNPATEADVNGMLEVLQRLMEQFSMPDDEREWFKTHSPWSRSNKYVELEARIYI